MISDSQFKALAVLYQGPARRTTGKTADGLVNRQAVRALCRRGLAQVTGTLFSITDEGRRTYEAKLARVPVGIDAKPRNSLVERAARSMRKLEASGAIKRAPLHGPSTPFQCDPADVKVRSCDEHGVLRSREDALEVAMRIVKLTDPAARVEYRSRDARWVVFRRVV